MKKEKELKLIRDTIEGCEKCPYLKFLRVDLASNPRYIGKYLFYCGKDYDPKKEYMLTVGGSWGCLRTPKACPLEIVNEQRELC